MCMYVCTFSNFLVKRKSSASLSRSAMGSAPDDSTKIKGADGDPSL
jgi:hypothetical protein